MRLSAGLDSLDLGAVADEPIQLTNEYFAFAQMINFSAKIFVSG